MQQFIYQFLPGDRPDLATNPDAWTDQDNKTASAHFAYLEAATDVGKVVLAGRAQDGVGPAIVVIEVSDTTEAAEFMEADPFVSSGMFRAQVHPFRVALSRDRV